MCGILCSSRFESSTDNISKKVWEDLKEQNARRGPDRSNLVNRQTISRLNTQLFASELQLRGEETVTQPHVSLSTGDVLCWNGEIFDGLNMDGSYKDNDGVKLMDQIQQLACVSTGLPEIFASVEGPYAFAFYENHTDTLYFARDILGRRSLLIHPPSPTEPFLLLTSTSCGASSGLVVRDLSTEGIFRIKLGDWVQPDCPPAVELVCSYDRNSLTINSAIPMPLPLIDPENLPEEISDGVNAFINHLRKSVQLRVTSIPSPRNQEARLAVLFSGGVDSSTLALLADSFVPEGEPIDLLNVAFENPRQLFLRSASMKSKTSKRKIDVALECAGSNVDSYDVPDRQTGREELGELRRLRPSRQWNFVEIDVTFKVVLSSSPYGNALIRHQESSSARSSVEKLMHPQQTVMDMSLGLALYFASRGVGYIQEGSSKRPYTSTARVLLSGLGSDELAGGYARHRTVYESGSWSALNEELQLEISRIPIRNLGRDDRIISSHGKELRVPFLSLAVVKFCAGLPVHFKVDPRLPSGVGDKLLVREAARRLGLTDASSRKKRAMQFGTRSARMELDGTDELRGDLPFKSANA